MKRFSLLLCVFVLVLWSFGIAGYATNNLNKMPATLFDRDTELNGVWIRVLDIAKFERTTWIEDRRKKGDLVKQDSLLSTWQYGLDTANVKVGFDPTDSCFRPSFRPSFRSQNTVTYLSAEAVPISGSGLLLIFAIGLVLVCASKFGEKLFKKSKR